MEGLKREILPFQPFILPGKFRKQFVPTALEGSKYVKGMAGGSSMQLMNSNAGRIGCMKRKKTGKFIGRCFVMV
jgi:hypothetical protein